MITVSEMTACLHDALEHPDRLSRCLHAFQHAIFEAPLREPGREREWRELEELARELAWYADDERMRTQEQELLGPRRAVRRIRAGLARLASTTDARSA